MPFFSSVCQFNMAISMNFYGWWFHIVPWLVDFASLALPRSQTPPRPDESRGALPSIRQERRKAMSKLESSGRYVRIYFLSDWIDQLL